MNYYPTFLNLHHKRCFIVGGGKIGERKARKLLEAGASLTIISPDLTPALELLKREKKLTHIKRRYKKGDLKDAFLVIAATSDESLNREISFHAPGLVNVVDMPGLCNFIVPSIVRRGDLTIAISTSGVSPSLAKSIRKELEKIYTNDFKRYLVFLKGFRNKIFSLSLHNKKREGLLKEAGSQESIHLLRDEGIKAVKEKLQRRIGRTCEDEGIDSF